VEEEDIRQCQRGHKLGCSCGDSGQQPGTEHTAVGLATRGPDVAHGEQGKANEIHWSTTVFDSHRSPDELAYPMVKDAPVKKYATLLIYLIKLGSDGGAKKVVVMPTAPTDGPAPQALQTAILKQDKAKM
jgi:hypothetical protein